MTSESPVCSVPPSDERDLIIEGMAQEIKMLRQKDAKSRTLIATLSTRIADLTQFMQELPAETLLELMEQQQKEGGQ